MQTLILTLHVLVCLILVVLVLLQAGKEGMGVIFGGGNASVFGSSGAGGLLAKLTAFLAVLFIVTSLSYNLLTSSRSEEESTILDIRLEEVPAPQVPAAPVVPETPEVPAVQPAPAASEAAEPAAVPGPKSPTPKADAPAAPEPSKQ